MKFLTSFRAVISAVFRRARTEDEMEEELRAHIERRTEDLERSGVSRTEAQRRARMEFGGYQRFKEECREALGTHFLETLIQDIRYCLRLQRKSPGFTSVAVLTLALGIGANTAIFSVVYGVLLRPLPYTDESRLVVLNETTPKVGIVSVSYPNFLDWRTQSKAFIQMATVHGINFNLAGVSQPENISGYAVSPNFLSMMGVHPVLGRDFDASEEKAGAAPVVLLSYALWQSHLGADPNAVGRTITLDGRSFTVVGVLPPDLRAIDKTDVMEPTGVWATNNTEATERGARGDSAVIGRLAPGTDLVRARAEMEGIAARLAKEYPADNDQFGVALQPIREAFVGNMRPAILVLFGAVVFVLLIACANVANLFLARSAGRTREIALRLACGASRGRLIRQMLTESFVLAVFGGSLGVALAVTGIRWMARIIPEDMLMGATLNANGPVLLFATGVIILAAVIFGFAPAAHSTKIDLQSELKEGGTTASASARQNRLRGALAIAEISLALVLLAGAGLMTKSLYRLLNVNPGFRPERVLKMEMDLRTAQYEKNPAILNFWNQVLDRVRVMPGVESAALGSALPLTGNHSRTDITIEGMPLPQPGSFPHPDIHVASPGYVGALGVTLLRGRAFTEADNDTAPRVAMVNSMLAQQFFPAGEAVGKRFLFGHPSTKNAPTWVTIVGVVGDTRMYGLANPPRLEIYVPLQQYPRDYMNLIVRTRLDPAALTSEVRAAVASIDKDQPIFDISTMDQVVSDSVRMRRMTLVVLGAFSAVALLLAAIGIYGVISYSVAQRTHEVGIRVALGAQRSDVLRLVIGHGARLAGVGILLGLGAALILTRLMSTLLYDVRASDPITFAGVAGLLALVSLAACYIPARRAMRVDPMVALRYE